MIQVRNLTKRYGTNVAVDRLSFTVEKGQVYGFLGPNGAGKTTTMNIMTGYIGPTDGEVLVDGIDVALEPEKAKMKIGYLPEQPPLYYDMTAVEYLRFAAELKKIPKKEREGQIRQVMEMTKIDHVGNRLIKNLSKGYKQRVGLAQALLGFPEIIILDEPTVGLDPKQIIEIRDLIKRLAREHTIILSSHILSEIQEVCDHILIIHQGRVAASGTQAELEKEFSGDTSIEVTVRGDLDSTRLLLSPVAAGSEITFPEKQTDGEATLVINNIGDRDIREDIFRVCAENDLPLLGMELKKFSLEHIFLKLTSENVSEEEALESEPAGEETGQSPNDSPSKEQAIQKSDTGQESQDTDGEEEEQ